MDYVLRLPIKHVIKLLFKAAERDNTNRLWDLYVTDRQNMTEETFVSFDEYSKPQVVDKRTEQEILNEVRKTLEVNHGVWAS